MDVQKCELEIYKRAIDEIAHVLITDGNGTITYVNDKYCSLTKYSREELIGQNNRIFKSGFHPQEFFVNMYKELNIGNTFKAKFKNKAKDGSYFWLDATIIPFLNENKIPVQFLAIRFDITDKINEVAIKEEFLADISHELRTPLHGLLSMVDLLSETSLNENQSEYVGHIKETSNHLGHLVNDLLDIFKMDSGKLKFELIPIDIRQLVVSMVEIFRFSEKSGVKLYHRIDENIQGDYLGDPTRLKQILYNLLGNAFKYTEKGSITVQVQLINEVDDYQYLEFKIIDTGIGIPPDKQEIIFDKYTQSEVKDTRLHGGTGLGLNIVKNLIQLLNGSFSLNSTRGEGTTFMFTLPFKKQTCPDELKEERTDIALEHPEKKFNILIAEDEKLNQLIYERQMVKFNYNYRITENGFETIELLLRETFDLLLLDMQMPGMNGNEVLRKIRSELPEPVRHIPVICVSATVNPTTIKVLQEAGANGYLTKPYKEIELTNIISKNIIKKNFVIEPLRLKEPLKQTTFINLEVLNTFAEGDTHFIIELLEYFKSTTPQVLESMQQNFSTNNNELSQQLHKYRSQVSLLGLTELTQLTLNLETALLEAKDFGSYHSDFEKLVSHSKEIILEITLLITKLYNHENTGH